MHEIPVNLGERSYRIQIRAGALDSLGSVLRNACPDAEQATIITDRNVAQHYSGRAVASLEAAGIATGTITIQPGEASKSLATAIRLYDGLAERKRGRHDPIVALGGGVVGDVAGFVAATWMRGVPFLQCPTSLEAMVDASVGGKTAVNHESGKNLIGAFYQPVGVVIDPECLVTLGERDFRAALAESVKHAVIADEKFLSWHESNVDNILKRDPTTMAELIATNCRIKSRIVECDERESVSDGVGRAALNFGHTIGHALEHGSKFSLRHGEAVSLGVVAALELSVERCGLEVTERDRIESLLNRLGLPTRMQETPSVESLWKSILSDKKNKIAGAARFVALIAVGRTVWLDMDGPGKISAPIYRILGR